jgi:hypothetical protein
VNTARRDRWLVAAGVAVMLVALVVVGRLQAGNLPEGDAAGSQPTTSTVPTDAAPVASGLAVAGRVALPGPAAAVAVGEDAVWVLLGQGTLLRVDRWPCHWRAGSSGHEWSVVGSHGHSEGDR